MQILKHTSRRDGGYFFCFLKNNLLNSIYVYVHICTHMYSCTVVYCCTIHTGSQVKQKTCIYATVPSLQLKVCLTSIFNRAFNLKATSPDDNQWYQDVCSSGYHPGTPGSNNVVQVCSSRHPCCVFFFWASLLGVVLCNLTWVYLSSVLSFAQRHYVSTTLLRSKQ